MENRRNQFHQLLHGSIEDLKMALNKQPELILDQDEKGQTFFEHATFTCYEWGASLDKYSLIVESAIKNGIDFSEVISNGKSLLQMAVSTLGGDPEINNVACILRYNPKLDLNIMCSSGMTALGYAVKNNHYSGAKSLISAGADVMLCGSPECEPIVILEKELYRFYDLLYGCVELGDIGYVRHWEKCIETMNELKHLMLASIENRAENHSPQTYQNYTPAITLLTSLESMTANLEVFDSNVLMANRIAAHLKMRADELKGYEDRLQSVMHRVRHRNEQMIENKYLSKHNISQCKSTINPSYALLTSDEKYKKAYEVKVKSFNLSLLAENKPERNTLDIMTDNTETYLASAKYFAVFLDFTKHNDNLQKDNQLFLKNFIQPLRYAIVNYREAKGEERKIAAYKKISNPLMALTTEMYKRAITVYPDTPEPVYFNPQASEMNTSSNMNYSMTITGRKW